MPDDIIVCPSCNRKLRMAEIHQGQIVQCPLCSVIFRTPIRSQPAGPPSVSAPGEATPPAVLPPSSSQPSSPPPSLSRRVEPQIGPDDSEPGSPEAGSPVIDVRRAVLLPGMGLIICGVLSGMAAILALQGALSNSPEEVLALMLERAGPELAPQMKAMIPPRRAYNTLIALCVGGVLIAVTTVLGGVNMLRLERYRLAMAGSILAVFNVISFFGLGVMPCCVLTAPLTLWSVTVLRLPEVRNSFDLPPEPESEAETEPEESE
jgi:hypothetical protein